MPKLVTEKIMTIIKTNVFLNGKIISIHCTNTCLKRLNSLRARTDKVSKNIKMLTQSIPASMKINAKRMLGKGDAKTYNIIKFGNEKGANKH